MTFFKSSVFSLNFLLLPFIKDKRHTMWNKIQTYLIGASTILTASLFFCRLATIVGPEGEDLSIMYYEKMPFTVMLIMLLSAGVCALFSHKSALLQSRVSMISVLMLIGFQIWLGIDFLRYHNELIFSPTILFPLICAALNIVAARKSMVDGMTIEAYKAMKKVRRKSARR